ncbi:MAG TPA: lipoprotein signal peptidase [Flavisolibacter sp.]
MKLRSAFLIVALVIIADQVLKFWIKTSFTYGPVLNMAGQKWAQLYFIENPGMAWGMELGGNWGKMILTLFRLAAVTFGTWYLIKIVRQNYSRGFIVCASLIYAGALGNLIDSMFYGLLFSESSYMQVGRFLPAGGGYGGFLHGKVVDMLYFPIVNSSFPEWMPLIGGTRFEFFSPIFNIADASISIGVITLLIFQKRFLHKKEETSVEEENTTGTQLSTEEAKQMI